MTRRRTILSVFGTRPELIKLAPVVQALAGTPGVRQIVCDTGQHREMTRRLRQWFRIRPDVSLHLMTPNQSLAGFAATALRRFDELLARVRPDIVVCQGDTNTAMIVALAAFYRQVRVAHVEAGLRSGDLHAPWPEEANRRIIDLLGDILFAPTRGAAANLLAEGVARDRVHVTGNTAIDALHWTLREARARRPAWGNCPAALRRLLATPGNGRLPVVVVTAHRRESFGAGLRAIARALRVLARRQPQLQWIFPVHLNPAVRDVMRRELADQPGIRLCEPLPYPVFSLLLARATLVVTDSGGLQEECPSLGTPVLVLRDVTERPEGVRSGNARLLGTDTAAIVRGTEQVLASPALYRRMATPRCPYGDGRAAARIARVLARES